MKFPKLTGSLRTLPALLEKYKFVLLVALIGVILLLLPTATSAKTGEGQSGQPALSFSLEDEEEKLRQALGKIEGAGKLELVLTLKTGAEQIYARNESTGEKEAESTLALSAAGSGQEETVPVKTIYPVYQGALVVCEGGDNPTVRLRITEAVSALTGLGADKIAISKMKRD